MTSRVGQINGLIPDCGLNPKAQVTEREGGGGGG